MGKGKLILTLSWIIAVATLLTLIVTLNKFGVITGQATSTAAANLTIATAASISFSDDACDFGSGAVDEGATTAKLYSNGTNNADGSWTNNACNGLAISNDGNVDVNLTLTSDKDSSTLIGGTGHDFEWILSGSCAGTNGLTSSTNVVASVGTEACDNQTIAATVDLDFYLVIPEDAPQTGGSSVAATITATGLAI